MKLSDCQEFKRDDLKIVRDREQGVKRKIANEKMGDGRMEHKRKRRDWKRISFCVYII